jgi:hypothetical protein
MGGFVHAILVVRIPAWVVRISAPLKNRASRWKRAILLAHRRYSAQNGQKFIRHKRISFLDLSTSVLDLNCGGNKSDRMTSAISAHGSQYVRTTR